MSHREMLEVGPLRQQAVCDLLRPMLVAVISKLKAPDMLKNMSSLRPSGCCLFYLPLYLQRLQGYLHVLDTNPKSFNWVNHRVALALAIIYITIFLFQESLGGVVFYGSKFPQRFYQIFNDTLLVSLLSSLLEKNVKNDEVQGPRHLRYLTRKRRKSQAEGGNCFSAFRMWLLQNMVLWCWGL